MMKKKIKGRPVVDRLGIPDVVGNEKPKVNQSVTLRDNSHVSRSPLTLLPVTKEEREREKKQGTHPTQGDDSRDRG